MEANRLVQTGGFSYKGRVLGVLAMSRSLGDHGLKDYVIAEPFVRDTRVDIDDSLRKIFVIVACDGLWDVMTDEEAVERVAAWTGDEEDVAQDLVNEALRRRTSDNVTVLVAWLLNREEDIDTMDEEPRLSSATAAIPTEVMR